LTISRNVIVKGHKGTLDFTTEVGKGSTFVVRLPLNGVDADGASTDNS
jgi:signal transduction histidine kinase